MKFLEVDTMLFIFFFFLEKCVQANLRNSNNHQTQFEYTLNNLVLVLKDTILHPQLSLCIPIFIIQHQP